MHPALRYLSYHTWHTILESEETAIKFMQEVGLIPGENSPCPPCPVCGAETRVNKVSGRKLSFRYVCSTRRTAMCTGTLSALKNTIMEDCKMPFRDIMAILLSFVKKIQVTEVIASMMNWRAFRQEKTISNESVIDYYKTFRGIAEIIASHHSKQLGGPGKTIVLDDTFLTKRKYNRNSKTACVADTVFAIFCKDNQEGIFFKTDGKKKKDLWPLVKQYVHPETAIIRHYKSGQSSLITSGKWICRDMALKYYRRSRLGPIGKVNYGEQVWQFIQDVIAVYPGCLKQGISLLQIDEVLPDKFKICDLMPIEIERNEDSDVAELSDLEKTYMDDDDEDDDNDKEWLYSSSPNQNGNIGKKTFKRKRTKI
ncbi:DDE_Tnp_IS1595 domain-containing protein [Caerostris darwini]|uniref:DDE_Tnp_IS1595 domain-containing protein n=1 Tax=Caerostris darwini TaxID=1538125 RepID=A0AAV4Q191_9ARAC|nr:DDE_Tnp_IS1595 domain-containing protein [Caerostris darwini]